MFCLVDIGIGPRNDEPMSLARTRPVECRSLTPSRTTVPSNAATASVCRDLSALVTYACELRWVGPRHESHNHYMHRRLLQCPVRHLGPPPQLTLDAVPQVALVLPRLALGHRLPRYLVQPRPQQDRIEFLGERSDRTREAVVKVYRLFMFPLPNQSIAPTGCRRRCSRGTPSVGPSPCSTRLP
jgi:hypothetical protein